MKRTSRKPSKLSESVQRHLNAYALAASAAGVGMLALAQSAEAKVVYTKTHQVIGTGAVYSLDFDHKGTTDFLIRELGYSATSTGNYNALLVKESPGNAVEGYIGGGWWSSHFASALKRGERIGPGQRFIRDGREGEVLASVVRWDVGTGRYGQWVDVNSRYLGLRFEIDGETHYGWVRLNVHLQGLDITATLTGYAYETIPNKPIITGKTKGPDVITLEPGSLGALAAGAAGRSTR